LFRTPFILPLFFSNLIWRINTNAKELFLTFDDGPIPGPTEFVLDTLNTYNAKATFFCIGDNISKHPDLFNRIVQNGHGIGNHTFNHLRGWGTSTEKYVDNVMQCEQEIEFHKRATINEQPSTTDQKTQNKKLFRPPYGRIRGKQINQLKDSYSIIMWDVLTSDYSRSLTPQKCLAGSVKATRPGSIIVFHDSLKAEKNMSYALPKYLDHFSNLGFSFKAIH
jgi:peptidoglycan-N-acetylglucosamine deacetylase